MVQLSSSSLNSSLVHYTFAYSKCTINESWFTQTLGTLYRIWERTSPHPYTFTHTSEKRDFCPISWHHSTPQISLSFLKPGSFPHSEMQTRHSVSPGFLPFHSCIMHQRGECLSYAQLEAARQVNKPSFNCISFYIQPFLKIPILPVLSHPGDAQMHHAWGISKTHFPLEGHRIPPRPLLDLGILPVDIGCTCGDHDSITHQHQHKEMHSIPLRYKERGSKTLRTVYTDLPTGYPHP